MKCTKINEMHEIQEIHDIHEIHKINENRWKSIELDGKSMKSIQLREI